MNKPRLIYMGGVVVDLVYRIEALPRPGQEMLASDFRVEAAGGFNTMLAARRAGMAVAYGGSYGNGFFGKMIRKALDAEGIGLLQASSHTADSGCCTVLVTADAERTFIYAPGCEFSLEAAAISRVAPDPADWVLLSGYALAQERGGAALADWLRSISKQASVIFDPSPLIRKIAPDVLARVLSRATWLTCNADEAQALSGIADRQASIERLATEICPGASGVLLRMSAEGCLLRLRDGTARHLPALKTKAVDTTGAGDVHTGAFIAAMAGGRAPEAAATCANAAAAISVTRPGGASAPAWHEIIALVEARPTGDAGPQGRRTEFPSGSVAPHLGEST